MGMAAPPPTPLSGCPLERLEIHGGPTCNIYDAAHLESSLTATLEAQRSTAGDHNNLLLQSHLGLRRVLSIQLSDLAKSPRDVTDILTVDQSSRRLSIQIYQIEQVVLLHFEKRQDFNSTISMLKRTGFRAKDGISLPVHTCITSESGSLSPHGYGPRLSSFTPLHSEGPHLSQSPFSFTSMLNSDVPLTQIQSPGTQFFGHQGQLYQPRVSSPLRNVIPMSHRSESPIPPTSNSLPIYPTNFVAMASLLNYRSISVPNLLSNSWQEPEHSPENSGTCCHASLDYSLSPSGSQYSNTSTGSSSQVMDEADNTFTLQHRQDFRKLMPRTRSLPFMKEKNHKVAKLKPAHKQNKPHNSSRAGCENKGIFINDSDIFIKEKTKASKMDSLDSSDGSTARSQLILRPTLAEPTASQAEDTLACRSSFEVAELPTMLITDPTLLERVNQSTSKLLDQYSADISRGCDVAAYTEFYLEQIHMVRRDFWLNQLN